MADKVLGFISGLIPFFAPYPAWVRGVFAAWVAVSAALVVSLVLAPRVQRAPTVPTPGPALDIGQPTQPVAQVWLVISGLELFGAAEGSRVRVEADVNGTVFTYPSIAGAKWAEVGPAMSPQQFVLPRTAGEYRISFKFLGRKGTKEQEYISQSTVVLRVPMDLPHKGEYSLYRLGEEGTRVASVSAELRFSVTTDPK
jgi:hypothetical protein